MLQILFESSPLVSAGQKKKEAKKKKKHPLTFLLRHLQRTKVGVEGEREVKREVEREKAFYPSGESGGLQLCSGILDIRA